MSGRSSGLPIPRFVSTKHERTNVRTGPGVQYPIKWIYIRSALPVDVVAEFGN
jgi:SH3-like domain-containing protein